MNVKEKFLLVFLCLSIASYGLSGSVYADDHKILPFSVKTNSDSYSTGDMILIFGAINNYDGTNPIVTIQIFGPLGGMKIIDQVTPNSDGSFSLTKKAQGTINLTGEYIVKAMWNKQPAETTFEFVGGVAPVPEPEIELKVTEPEVTETIVNIPKALTKAGVTLADFISDAPEFIAMEDKWSPIFILYALM